jgi:hypothetical protein
MCNVAVIEFFIESVEKEEFEDKRVLRWAASTLTAASGL